MGKLLDGSSLSLNSGSLIRSGGLVIPGEFYGYLLSSVPEKNGSRIAQIRDIRMLLLNENCDGTRTTIRVINTRTL